MLLWPVAQVDAELLDRVSKGRALVDGGRREGPGDVEELEETAATWRRYNFRYLERAFTTREVAEGYSYQTMGVISTSYRDTPALQLRRLRDDIRKEIGYLESLREQLPLYERGVTAAAESPPAEPTGPAVAAPTRSASGVPSPSLDPRKVFVIHGRDEEARKAVFAFLHDLDLHPLPWEELVAATGSACPYNGMVVHRAFAEAQAVVVVLTPDDEARLHPDLHREQEEEHEREFTGQPRPNVLLEAGMALMAHPTRTVFVEIGRLRPVSDLSGLNTVRLGVSPAPLLALKQRLAQAGCTVNDRNSSWMDAQRFAKLAARTRQPASAASTESKLPRGWRLTMAPRPAEPRLTARILDRGENSYLFEVTNRGGVTLRNVTWEPSPEITNWQPLNQVLPRYPYDELPPRQYVRVPIMITMGGPIVGDFILAGDTPDGQRYETTARLSLFG